MPAWKLVSAPTSALETSFHTGQVRMPTEIIFKNPPQGKKERSEGTGPGGQQGIIQQTVQSMGFSSLYSFMLPYPPCRVDKFLNLLRFKF